MPGGGGSLSPGDDPTANDVDDANALKVQLLITSHRVPAFRYEYEY